MLQGSGALLPCRARISSLVPQWIGWGNDVNAMMFGLSYIIGADRGH